MLLIVVFVIAFGVAIAAAPKVAFADSGTLNYDTTDVMDDLTTSTESGEGFDIKDYPYNENGTVQVINFLSIAIRTRRT